MHFDVQRAFLLSFNLNGNLNDTLLLLLPKFEGRELASRASGLEAFLVSSQVLHKCDAAQVPVSGL